MRKRRDEADLSAVDWAKIRATTDGDIERMAAEDPDTPPPATDEELARARWVVPTPSPDDMRFAEGRDGHEYDTSEPGATDQARAQSMATGLKRPADLYAEDFHAWAEAQMEALRRGAGRLPAEIDAEHLIEELDMARRRDRAAASSQVMRTIEHLLKLEHSPSEAPRNGWLRTLRSARTALRRLLTSSLRRAVEADLAELYAVARENAAGALQDSDEFEAADALPERCPYTLDQITGDWLPGPTERPHRAPGRDSG